MAKKYHQTRKDREDESRGMERYERRREGRSHHDFVTGHDPEIGRDSYAGLPEDKVMAMYPKSPNYRGGRLDDTISDIDAIQRDGDEQIDRHLSHQK